MLLPLFLLAIIPLTSAETYTLHHRFLPIPHDASSPAPPFNPRGTIDLLPTPPDALSAELSATFQPDDAAGGGGVDDGNGWYQVALQVRNEWLLASTRSCNLAAGSAEVVTLYVTGDSVTGLGISLGSIPSAGECKASSVVLPSGGMEVIVRVPKRVQSPSLAPPPVVDPTTGQPAPPPIEKSFLQKYWMPMLGLAVFSISQLAPDPPRAAGASGGGGGAR